MKQARAPIPHTAPVKVKPTEDIRVIIVIVVVVVVVEVLVTVVTVNVVVVVRVVCVRVLVEGVVVVDDVCVPVDDDVVDEDVAVDDDVFVVVDVVEMVAVRVLVVVRVVVPVVVPVVVRVLVTVAVLVRLAVVGLAVVVHEVVAVEFVRRSAATHIGEVVRSRAERAAAHSFGGGVPNRTAGLFVVLRRLPATGFACELALDTSSCELVKTLGDLAVVVGRGPAIRGRAGMSRISTWLNTWSLFTSSFLKAAGACEAEKGSTFTLDALMNSPKSNFPL
jgi:hypothetical protein